MQQEQAEPEVQPAQDPADQPQGQEGDGKVAYESYRKLLDEKKKTQARLEELQKAKEEADEARKLEEGKFQEVAEEYKKKYEEVSPYKERWEAFEEEMKSEIESIAEKLDEDKRQILDLSESSTEKKLKLARLLRGEEKTTTPSVASARPGNSGTPTIDFSQYEGSSKEAIIKRIRLRKENPKAYEELQRQRKAMTI